MALVFKRQKTKRRKTKPKDKPEDKINPNVSVIINGNQLNFTKRITSRLDMTLKNPFDARYTI